MSNQSKLFFNIQGDGPGVANEAVLFGQARAVQPRWALVMNNTGLAWRLKAASPQTNVIMRHEKGERYWLNRPPGAFLDYCAALDPQRRFWHSGVCEDNNLAYDAALVEENARRSAPINLVCCDYSTGTPQPEEWASADGMRILAGASQHRQFTVIGLHYGYFNTRPTMGWQGNVHQDIKPDTWPTHPDPQASNWHVARHKFALNAFRAKYPTAPAPRFVYTEGGPEATGDKGVLDIVGEKVEGGWRNHQNWWQQKWGLTPDQALYLCLYYLCEVQLADSHSPEVEGALLFCYGWNGDSRWHFYNVEGLTRFHELHAAWERPSLLPQLDKIVPPPPPTMAILPHIVTPVGCNYVNIRAGRSTKTAVMGKAFPGGLVASTGVPSDGWLDVFTPEGVEGYVSAKYAQLKPLTAAQWAAFKKRGD